MKSKREAHRTRFDYSGTQVKNIKALFETKAKINISYFT
jgi:hypothetical protein